MRNQPFLVAGVITRGCRKHWSLTHHDGTKMHEMKLESVGGRLRFTPATATGAYGKSQKAVKAGSQKNSRSVKAGSLKKKSDKSVAFGPFGAFGLKPFGGRGVKKIPRLGY